MFDSMVTKEGSALPLAAKASNHRRAPPRQHSVWQQAVPPQTRAHLARFLGPRTSVANCNTEIKLSSEIYTSVDINLRSFVHSLSERRLRRKSLPGRGRGSRVATLRAHCCYHCCYCCCYLAVGTKAASKFQMHVLVASFPRHPELTPTNQQHFCRPDVPSQGGGRG